MREKPRCPKRSGHTVAFCFQYGTDKASWYWREQVDQDVPGTGQRLRVPNPQSPDTLPVAAKQGSYDRISAIYFDLVAHGIPYGSKITNLVLTLGEGTGQNQNAEQPEYNVKDRSIAACPAKAVWASGAAELWGERPKLKAHDCVTGVRHRALTPRWTFDLTRVAKNWAADSFANNDGVVLVPVIKGNKSEDKNWQVNLKIPERDDTKTKGPDEYRNTRGRAFVSVTFVKPKPPKPSPSPSSPSYVPSRGIGGGTNITGAPPIGGVPPYNGSGPIVNGGSNPTVPSTPPPSTEGGSSGGGGPPATTLTSPPPIPTVRFPWYAWILLPVALLCLAAVRSVIFEQTRAGIRPDGVISSIRSKNGATVPPRRGAMAGIVARAMARKEKPDSP